MSITEIIDAKPWHVGQITRTLRPEQKKLMNFSNNEIHKILTSVYQSSAIKKALIVDGKLLAIWGVIGTLSSFNGFIWMVISEEGERAPVKVARIARKLIEEYSEIYSTLVTTFQIEDLTAKRFLKFVGFIPADLGYILPDGYAGMERQQKSLVNKGE